MNIRSLVLDDAPRMLEWMQNADISHFFRFSNMIPTDSSVRAFIQNSNSTTHKHFAVTDDNNEYMGTVSLKNIDPVNKNAEYAIALHMDAIGKGYAQYATDQILNIAFFQLNLHRVYLNVLSINHRAIRFYEKYGFILEGESRDSLFHHGMYQSLKWYSLLITDFQTNVDS